VGAAEPRRDRVAVEHHVAYPRRIPGRRNEDRLVPLLETPIVLRLERPQRSVVVDGQARLSLAGPVEEPRECHPLEHAPTAVVCGGLRAGPPTRAVVVEGIE